MFTPGFRFFFGFGLLALAGAVVYGFATGGDQGVIEHVLGPLTLGWKGGVGEHFGYTVLVAAGFVSMFIGCLLVAFRDADPEAQAGALEVESVPLTQAPADASYWPIVGAFAVMTTLIGLLVGRELLLVGLTFVVITIIEWTVKAWSERATGDAGANRELRNRIMFPLEIPVAGFLLIATVFVGVSRVFLAASKTGAVIFGGVVAVLVFGFAIAIALRPELRKSLTAVAVVLLGLAVIGGGIAAAVIGERDFEEHGAGQVEGAGATLDPAPLSVPGASGAIPS